jgi:hypothetical protein
MVYDAVPVWFGIFVVALEPGVVAEAPLKTRSPSIERVKADVSGET